MACPVLLIGEAGAPATDGLVGLLTVDGGFSLQRADWETPISDALRRSAARIIFAVPGERRQGVLGFLDRMRSNPVGVPMFAVLPDTADDEVTRCTVEAADDFALFPLRQQELHHRVARLLGPDWRDAQTVRRRLTEELGLAQLVGRAASFTRIVEQLPPLARADSPVLLTGETGTGKELFARAIHHLGKRRNLPFVPVDCAAVPDHLFENEFFGHARGAYTDAHRDQKGLVALAEGGTIFLDEVDALSAAAQAKLLRFLQEHTFRPLGSERNVHADVNVIAATNHDLERRVAEKLFRSDLYFRLNVLRLHLPPLRERHGDVALLVRHFLETHHPARGRATLSPPALQKLLQYSWPGNVRELFNVLHRAAVLTEGAQISADRIDLPGVPPPAPSSTSFRTARAGAIAAFERAYVEELLRKHDGNVTRAAREARKERRAFGRLVKRYGIERRAP